MWKNHPEEYFMMRADWVDKTQNQSNIERHYGRQQWLDNFDNRQE